MLVASIVFTAAGVAAAVLTEVLRSVVHAHRERRDGLGGTQDIAMWGTLVMGVCFVLASACLAAWFAL